MKNLIDKLYQNIKMKLDKPIMLPQRFQQTNLSYKKPYLKFKRKLEIRINKPIKID